VHALLSLLESHRRIFGTIAAILIAAVAVAAAAFYFVPRSHGNPTRLSGSQGGGDSGSGGANGSDSSSSTDTTSGGGQGSDTYVPGTEGTAGRAGSSGFSRLGAGNSTRFTRGTGKGPGAGARSVGVDTTSIKVGFVHIDFGAVNKVIKPGPGATTGDPMTHFNAFFKDVNNHGGINGRQIIAVDEPFDVVNPADQARACVDLTETKQVFAVISAGYFNQGPCITDHGVFYYEPDVASREDFDAAGGLLATVQATGQRVLQNWAANMESRGSLIHGHTIGTVEDGSAPAQQMFNEGLIPVLHAANDDPAVRSQLSNQNQIQVEVNRQKLAGVDVVFMGVDPSYSSPWIAAADNADWHPHYFTSDFLSTSEDFWADGQSQSLDGAFGTTALRTGQFVSGAGEPPLDASCRQRYQQITGQSIAPGTREYPFVELACGLVGDFAAAAGRAGAHLNTGSLSNGFRSLGVHPFPYHSDISYGSNKLDGGDYQRAVQWHYDCTSGGNAGCYELAEPSFSHYSF
jgi:hypothetical protein